MNELSVVRDVSGRCAICERPALRVEKDIPRDLGCQ
jgi:hypothetical protein